MDIFKFLSELKEFGLKNDIPNVTETNAKFLRDLIKISKSKNILEIGTANGYSTINMGIEVQKNSGKITTIEFSSLSHFMAVENFEKVKMKDFINAINGNAIDVIPELEGKYDFVFIDGMKKRYKDFLNLVWDKVEDGGIIILDDVIKFRHKMEDFYEMLDEKQISYNLIPIDEDDGIIMIIK